MTTPTLPAAQVRTQPTLPPPPSSRSDCTCGDPDVDRVLALMADGLDQITASRIVWGGVPDVPATPEQVAPWVRRRFAEAFPWLRVESGAAVWWLLVVPLLWLAVGYSSAMWEAGR